MTPKDIIELMRDPSAKDSELITRAFAYAKKAHEGYFRFSGDPYFTHPYEVAKILAGLHVDAETIAAGLLHDTIEDGVATEEGIKQEFGPTILFLVDGVTKLGKPKYRGAERHVESLRKFFVAMAADVRVLMIRLADRLHNIQTLQYVRPDKQRRIALETIEIYASIANRLGMWRIKGLLEDGSFPYAYPKDYAKVVTLRKTKGRESFKRLEKIYRSLERELAERGITDVKIDYRVKYLYSLYKKLLVNNMNIENIYDISALRVIVNSIEECYQVLGVVHNLWRPVPGRLRDYIALPKPNGYKSIHTAIVAGDGSVAEIQIRTKAMQQEAEFGTAAHLAYVESGKPFEGGKMPKSLAWIQELIEWQKHVKETDEFLTGLKTDFFQDRIFVFTPKGEVVELPATASPIDFAYSIHSDIGDHAAGAKINGKFVALDSQLKQGDVIEIEVKKTSHPTAKWLDHTVTTEARKHIRTAITQKKRKSE